MEPEKEKKEVIKGLFRYYLMYFGVLVILIIVGMLLRPETRGLPTHVRIIPLVLFPILACFLYLVARISFSPLKEKLMEGNEKELSEYLFSMPRRVALSLLLPLLLIPVLAMKVPAGRTAYFLMEYSYTIGLVFPVLGYFLMSHFVGKVCEAASNIPGFKGIYVKKMKSSMIIVFLLFLIIFLGILETSATLIMRVKIHGVEPGQISDILLRDTGLMVLKGLIFLGIIVFLFLNYLSRPVKLIIEGMERVKDFDYSQRVPILMDNELGYLSSHFNYMQKMLEKGEKIKRLFSKYVSTEVLGEILKYQDSLDLYGKDVEVSILFIDISNFTTHCEKLPPHQIIKALNKFYKEMETVIFDNRGTIKQFAGDEIMVIFGAPRQETEHAALAVKTAVEMIGRLDELKSQAQADTLGFFDAKIGIHSGKVVVGNIGTENRAEYTVIGDVVNIASRLEGLNKNLNTRILISEETYRESALQSEKGETIYRDMGLQSMKGRTGGIRVFSLERESKFSPDERIPGKTDEV
ncbi:MAG: hypothetical protein K8T10_02415 [Candidatus Eremiobacteraeota bacterium]|nr:hypothetical protein [Candidatus Eremiobacteraeota bacterium]